ncbi:unnamed protein product [Owenia fusiformis]|uniref:Uncharacterized protein n=1 Tax=Owenia fusiformis TaxID=6347 RepID=A0A8J1UWC3_OWEFU|nr:unnamed protein product [Owenia fusiformis]
MEEKNMSTLPSEQAGYGYEQPPNYNQSNVTIQQPGAHPPVPNPQAAMSHTTVVQSQPGRGGMNPNVVTTGGGIHQTTIVNTHTKRNWSSGICSCFDDLGSCCFATWCPAIMDCVLADEMGESFCVPVCVPGGTILIRQKLRLENNIQGSVCDDCIMAACCYQCHLCQMKREIKYIQCAQQQMTVIQTGY